MSTRVREGMAVALVAFASVIFGVLSGSYITARAQSTPVTDPAEKMHRIQEHIRAKIAAVDAQFQPADRKEMGGNNPRQRFLRKQYYFALATEGKADVLFGHYLRYMSPVLKYYTNGVDMLADDRYISDFALGIAAYGYPPAAPNIDDANWRLLGTQSLIQMDNWPYTRAAAAVLGE